MNKITDINGSLIAYRGLTVTPECDTMKIKTRMLDGSWSIQQIGDETTKLNVSIAVTDMAALNVVCNLCMAIQIHTRDKIYTGIISSTSIAWARISRNWIRGSFELAVSEVTDR